MHRSNIVETNSHRKIKSYLEFNAVFSERPVYFSLLTLHESPFIKPITVILGKRSEVTLTSDINLQPAWGQGVHTRC